MLYGRAYVKLGASADLQIYFRIGPLAAPENWWWVDVMSTGSRSSFVVEKLNSTMDIR